MPEGTTVDLGRANVAAWFAVVVYARMYTVVLCDVPERLLDIDWISRTWIHRIPTYLWVELIFFGPVIWFAMHRVISDAFGQLPIEPAALALHQRRRLVAEAAMAIFIYGVGVHAADIVEVFSREHEGIDRGEVYRLVYFLDEDLSHYLQFVPLFFVVGWIIMFDRRGRTSQPLVASLLGVGHGIERGLGIIEGEKWAMGPVVLVWIAVAVWVRRRRAGGVAFDEFFVRYGLGFVVALPVCQVAYALRFGGFPPPSSLDGAGYAQLAAGVAVLAGVACAAAVLLHGRASRTAARRG